LASKPTKIRPHIPIIMREMAKTIRKVLDMV